MGMMVYFHTMKLRLLQLDLLALLISHLDPYGVATSIERRFDYEPLLRGRGWQSGSQ